MQLAKSATDRFKKLVAQGFVSSAQLDNKTASEIEQQQHLAALDDSLAANDRDNWAMLAEQARLPGERAAKIAQLDRQRSEMQRRVIDEDLSAERGVTVAVDGTAASVAADVGQSILVGQNLASVVPDGASMEVVAFAPSQDVGGIHPGEKVYLRYDAYPFQRSGFQEGTVENVSVAPPGSDQLVGTYDHSETHDPRFAVRIHLDDRPSLP